MRNSGERIEPTVATLILAIQLIDDDVTRQRHAGTVSRLHGEVVCPHCGGNLQYVYTGPRALKATCDTCSMKVNG